LKISRIQLIQALFLLCFTVAKANTWSTSETIHLELKKTGGGEIVLKEKYVLDCRLLAEKYTHLPEYLGFYDNRITPILKIKASVNSNPLKRILINKVKVEQRDVLLNDFNYYYPVLEKELKTGEFVRLTLKREYNDFGFLGTFQVFNSDSIEHFRMEIKHPEEYAVDFKVYTPWKDVDYTIFPLANGTGSVLAVEAQSGKEKLEYFPFDSGLVYVALKISRGDSLLTLESEEQFSAWYNEKVPIEPELFAELPAELLNQLDSSQTDRQELALINRWVRDKVRYIAEEVGLRAYIPDNAESVLHRRYGDCKNKANLVAAIARARGIEVYFALCNTRKSIDLPGFAVGKFNHMLCAWNSAGSWEIFDPTDLSGDLGMLPSSVNHRGVLILNPGGAEWIDVCQYPTGPQYDIHISADIDSLSLAKATIHLNSQNSAMLNKALKTETMENLQNDLSILFGQLTRSITFKNFEIIDSSAESIMLSARVDLKLLLISGRKGVYLPKMPLISFNPEILDRIDDNESLTTANDSRVRLSLDLAGNFPEAQMDSLEFTLEDGQFYKTWNERITADKIRFVFELSRFEKFYQDESKSDFLSFVRTLQKNQKEMFRLGQLVE
jgi:hypothetical protein